MIISVYPVVTLSGAAVPRLTVFVVVDGLEQESLDRLRPYWPQGGLRTLAEEAYQTTLSFPHLVYGGSEMAATLITGTTPSEHGVAADTYFSRADRRPHLTYEDKDEQGIGCQAQLSPRNLLSATLGDEWRVRYGSRTRLYALGINPLTTLTLAGHSANGCCWLDSMTAQWASTSYYGQALPKAIDAINAGSRHTELIAGEWTPRMDIDLYTAPTEAEQQKAFAYSNSRWLHTPVVNTMVIEAALALQRSEHLGEDNIPDLLCLQLTSVSPKAYTDQLRSAEQEDMLLWLNQDLGYLIDQITRNIGSGNLRVVLVGCPHLGQDVQALAAARLPVKAFDVDRAAALTSTYLMALYGTERWIDGGYGQSIYLNRTLIEQKKLSLPLLQQQVANFLMEFEGVSAAYPFTEAMQSALLAQTVNKKCFGDVIFTLQPHWLLTAGDIPLDRIVEQHPTAPLMIWGGPYQAFPQGIRHADELKAWLMHD